MSGGFFPNYPFKFNVKCIIFTIIIAVGYWFLPYRNLFVLFFLFWFPYIALAWYDYSYKCHDKLEPTIVPFGRYLWLPFKPQGYKDKFNKLPKEAIRAMDTLDHTLGWSLLSIVVLYAIYYFYSNKTEKKIETDKEIDGVDNSN